MKCNPIRQAGQVWSEPFCNRKRLVFDIYFVYLEINIKSFSFLAFAVISINTVLNVISIVNSNNQNNNNNNNNNLNDFSSVNMNTGAGRRRRRAEDLLDLDKLEDILHRLSWSHSNEVGRII